jgi:hypothetical protein
MADPSKINSLVLFKGKKVSTEKIDERILELLGLQDEYELSYDEYIGYLREAMVASRMSKSRYSTAETESITNEWKRVKSKKGRFRPKKISAESFKKGSAAGINFNKQKALTGTKPLALPPATNKMAGGNEIATIIDALGEIIKSLTQQNKDAKKASELDRKSAEQKTRGEKESRLEKGVGLIAKAAEKILAPFKSILSRIIDFITAVFFGRLMIKLLRWFGDPENQKKFQSILRFLGDHWPTLLALYLRFGTGIGKLVGTLSSILIKGGLGLAAAAAGLLAKAGVGKAGKFAKFLGGKKGKLLGAGLEVAATVGTTMALSSGIESIGKDKPKVEGRAGGGSIKIPKFAGGGLNFGGLGNMFSGLVSGQKGVDKIPAMLSDGEFVMSRGAVQKYGVDTLEGMNAAGGGTNKPKMISGIPHAYGGGYITSTGREDSRANYDKKHGEGSYTKKLAEKRAKSASEDDADIARRKMSQSSNNRPAKSSGQKKTTGDKKITVNDINVTGLAGLAGSLKGMGPNVTVTRDTGSGGMRPDMQRKLAEENKKSAAMDASRAKEANLHKQARREYSKILNNPNDPRYDAATNGNLKVADVRKQLQAKETASPTPQAAYKAAGMGNYSAANVGRAQSAAGVGVGVGAKMVGGYGLKKQGFKDSPSSQIIKNDKGQNVVGYKAMKGGKLTYVQGKKPGEGTSNIWERMGRAINPNAYKQSDAASAQKKYQEASAGSIQSLKDRGASQLTIAKRQAQLKKTAPAPPTPPKTRFVNPSQGGAKTKSQLAGGGGKPSAPKFSASHPGSNASRNAKVLGIK